MPSTFTWLDYSEKERRAMLDVIEQFRQRDTRDELGLATIRDAFSDLLFPGTGALQSRARYFLFVPWMYRALEAKETPSEVVESKARKLEAALIEELKATEGPEQGVIGARSGAALKRMPSNIYWLGLATWGILRFPGGQDAYHRSLDAYYGRAEGGPRQEDGEPLHQRTAPNWDAALPEAPDDFPKGARFALRQGEAGYLRDQVMRHAPGRMLAWLVGLPPARYEYGEFPWEHAQAAALPPLAARHLHHARCFAEAMHGASLLYNLRLAQLENKGEWEADHRERIEAWREDMRARHDVLARWWAASDSFWGTVLEGTGTRTATPVRNFVHAWLGWLFGSAPGSDPSTSANAVRLVESREQALKGPLSRFTNKRARELWGGYSGAGRLDYRWGTVRRIAADIHDGLVEGGSRA